MIERQPDCGEGKRFFHEVLQIGIEGPSVGMNGPYADSVSRRSHQPQRRLSGGLHPRREEDYTPSGRPHQSATGTISLQQMPPSCNHRSICSGDVILGAALRPGPILSPLRLGRLLKGGRKAEISNRILH